MLQRADAIEKRFISLIDEHGNSVISVARRVIGDTEDALEITQEVFTAAFIRWGKINNKAKIRSWLLTVARNKSLDLLRKRQREPVILQLGDDLSAKLSWNTDYCPDPGDHLVMEEIRNDIRNHIRKLNNQYQRVLRLHYIEDFSLPEIAKKLCVPVGTIKWRLSQARDRLREEMIMSKMTDEIRNRSTKRPVLNVGTIWGSHGPDVDLRSKEVMKTLLAQQILFSIRKKPRSVEEIVNEVRAEDCYVLDHLDRMVRADIVTKQNGSYRANCILLDQEDEQELIKILGKRGKFAADAICQNLARIDKTVEKCSFFSSARNRDMLRWIFIGVFILNHGVRHHLKASGNYVGITPPDRPDGGKWHFLPRLIDSKIPVEIGCNMYDWKVGDTTIGTARYWNSDYPMPSKSPNPKGSFRDILHPLMNGPVSVEELAQKASEEYTAWAIEAGYVQRDGSNAILAIPLFTEDDNDNFSDTVDKIASDVIKAAFDGFPKYVYELLDRLGFSFIRSDYPARAASLGQLGAMRELVKSGALLPPKKDRPESWGVFAWKGAFSLVNPF